MATEIQGIFKNYANQIQNFPYMSDDYTPIVRDGKMYVYKVQLEDIYERRHELKPYRNKTFTNFLSDLKTMSKRNIYMMPFVEENESFLVFDCGRFESLTPDNLHAALPALKRYVQFNKNIENDLKIFYLQSLGFDQYTRKIKIVDISSLWYDNWLEGHVFHGHKDLEILNMSESDSVEIIYSLLPPSVTNELKIRKYIDKIHSENKQFRLEYV